VRAAPDETQHIWKLDGPLEDVPNDEVPSMAWQHMAHTGSLPLIWDLLDLQPSAETLHLLNLVEFTDLLNGCALDALVRNVFVILRVVATARYLHLKSQELHEALREAHVTIGEEADERVRLREEIQLSMQATRRSPFSRSCPRSIKKPRLLPLSMLSAPGLPNEMLASSEVRLDRSSRISLGPATTSPQPWSSVSEQRHRS
jgi:hypothetical protein